MLLENNSAEVSAGVGAFFDLDLTITDRDSFRFFLKKHYLGNFHNWHLVPQVLFWGIMRKIRLIPLVTLKGKALAFLNGKPEEEIRQIGEDFFEQQISLIIRKKAVEQINWHKSEGHAVYLVTSCPNIYIHNIADSFAFDGYECTDLVFTGGKFTGNLEAVDCFGSEKARRISLIAENHGLNLATSYAYSDHESDLPMLEMVGVPVAVSPTPILKTMAAAKGWQVEHW